jgi:threonine dehydrogenase-like Zn-dependent dehydrogenase
VRAAIVNPPGAISVDQRPDPVVSETTDAVGRVALASVCGSGLWSYGTV